MSFTDIRNWNWIERLPKFMRPYVYLMRLDRPIGWWLLLLPAWWSIIFASETITGATFYLLVLFTLGAILMRGAGCVINDLWDRDLDKQVERTAKRPIANGDIGIEDAAIFLVILLGISLTILLQLPFLTIILGVLTLPLIIIYPLMKRFTWWPQAFLGITFNFGALMGWSAVTGELSAAPFILYAAGFLWTLGYDTIYAHQDIEDDMRIGIKSTAILFAEKSQTYVYGFYAGAALLFSTVFFMQGMGAFSLLVLGLAFLYGAYRLSQWNPDSQDSSLEIFSQDNRDIGLLMFLALVV